MQHSMNPDNHWLRLPQAKDQATTPAGNVLRSLQAAGITADIKQLDYAAGVMFGQGLDDLNCGYCHHSADTHIWGLEPDQAGRYLVDHFNCRQCAQDRRTSLVVCYIRPGSSMARDGF